MWIQVILEETVESLDKLFVSWKEGYWPKDRLKATTDLQTKIHIQSVYQTKNQVT